MCVWENGESMFVLQTLLLYGLNDVEFSLKNILATQHPSPVLQHDY